ncbi:MAG: type I methionyl aminopeptidase [Christensenellales bacterium]
MIITKSAEEIRYMKVAGAIVKDTLDYLREHIRPGVTTAHIDALCYEYLTKRGAKPSSLGYEGYPASICTSVEDEIVHGIPGRRVLKEGEIITLDLCANINGYHGDAARTFAVGEISPEKKRLIEVCEQSFEKGLAQFREGNRLGDISHAIQEYVESNGYSVVRELVGHGIGREMHEDPNVPNYGTAGKGIRLTCGMALAIEPMINMGRRYVRQLDDGWTIVTEDGLPSAHYGRNML